MERLLEQSLPKTIPVPNVEPGRVKPSGFRMPTAKVGDHPYYVKRNPNWMLPVYVNQPWSLGQPQATITVIRSVYLGGWVVGWWYETINRPSLSSLSALPIKV